MNRIGNTITRTLRLLPRAALIGMLIAVPVLAVPSLADSRDTVIEAPTPKKMGAGFVLLISLQRA